jgi:beta-lactamase class D
VTVLALLLAAGLAAASTPAAPSLPAAEPAPQFRQHFARAGVTGGFLLWDLDSNRLRVDDAERAARGFLPASTFKIFNGLVALEEGVVRDAEQVFPWDGVERPVEAWNRDQTFRSAMRVSAVWVFQEIARQIGPARMQRWLDRVGYGNRDISGGIDRFWLDGALRITPLEQARFVARLARGDLPFSARTLEIVRDVLVVERGPGYVLRAKTGWAEASTPATGWYVGWVERGGAVHVFVLELDIRGDGDAPQRLAVTRSILAAAGLVPEVLPDPGH